MKLFRIYYTYITNEGLSYKHCVDVIAKSKELAVQRLKYKLSLNSFIKLTSITCVRKNNSGADYTRAYCVAYDIRKDKYKRGWVYA